MERPLGPRAGDLAIERPGLKGFEVIGELLEHIGRAVDDTAEHGNHTPPHSRMT